MTVYNAYSILAIGDKVYGAPSSIIGNIGTHAQFMNFKGLLE